MAGGIERSANLDRGIYCDVYRSHHVYKAICSDGSELASGRVPNEKEDDRNRHVIGGLWDMLEAVDPRPSGNGRAHLRLVR